jgi:hypothetical protein
VRARDATAALEALTTAHAQLKTRHEAYAQATERAILQREASNALARAGITDPDVARGLGIVLLEKAGASVDADLQVTCQTPFADLAADLASKVRVRPNTPEIPTTSAEPIDPKDWRQIGLDQFMAQ